VFTYKGTDPPAYTTTGGRPTRLTFTGNTVDNTGGDVLKITDTDAASFSGTTVTGRAGGRPGVRLSFTVGGLVPGRIYMVTANGVRLTTVVANSSGTVTFMATPSGTAEVDYVIAPRQIAAPPPLRW